jgi:hypothetical protein
MRFAVSKRAWQQLITNPFLGNISISRSIEEMFLLKWISLFLPWERKAKYFVPKDFGSYSRLHREHPSTVLDRICVP